MSETAEKYGNPFWWKKRKHTLDLLAQLARGHYDAGQHVDVTPGELHALEVAMRTVRNTQWRPRRLKGWKYTK